MSSARQLAAAWAHVSHFRKRKPAEVALTEALRDAVDDGKIIPCQLWPTRFTSEYAEVRATAVPLCADCPVRMACHRAAMANREDFGVWAGVDRTKFVDALNLDT